MVPFLVGWLFCNGDASVFSTCLICIDSNLWHFNHWPTPATSGLLSHHCLRLQRDDNNIQQLVASDKIRILLSGNIRLCSRVIWEAIYIFCLTLRHFCFIRCFIRWFSQEKIRNRKEMTGHKDHESSQTRYPLCLLINLNACMTKLKLFSINY